MFQLLVETLSRLQPFMNKSILVYCILSEHFIKHIGGFFCLIVISLTSAMFSLLHSRCNGVNICPQAMCQGLRQLSFELQEQQCGRISYFSFLWADRGIHEQFVSSLRSTPSKHLYGRQWYTAKEIVSSLFTIG